MYPNYHNKIGLVPYSTGLQTLLLPQNDQKDFVN